MLTTLEARSPRSRCGQDSTLESALPSLCMAHLAVSSHGKRREQAPRGLPNSIARLPPLGLHRNLIFSKGCHAGGQGFQKTFSLWHLWAWHLSSLALAVPALPHWTSEPRPLLTRRFSGNHISRRARGRKRGTGRGGAPRSSKRLSAASCAGSCIQTHMHTHPAAYGTQYS